MIYLGFDVLDFYEFNRKGTISETLSRRFVILDNGAGKRTPDELSPAAAPVRSFVWTCFDMEEIAQLRTWLDERNGRAVPFWMPTYQRDASLAVALLEDEDTATINWIRYRQQFFPNTNARRHLAIYPQGGGTLDLYGIVDADDPGDQLTETLNLAPAAARLYPTATTVVSFLKLCRLEDDFVEISHDARGFAEATIKVREIPEEAPEPEE